MTCTGATDSDCESCDTTNNHREVNTAHQCVCKDGFYDNNVVICVACDPYWLNN